MDNVIALVTYSRALISVSSRVNICDIGSTIGESYCKFVNQFSPVYIKGFTDEEASQYIERRELRLSFNDVKHVTGNKPLSLSLVEKVDQHSLTACEGVPRITVRSLLSHVKGLVKNVNTIDEYFVHDCFLNCINLVHV